MLCYLCHIAIPQYKAVSHLKEHISDLEEGQLHTYKMKVSNLVIAPFDIIHENLKKKHNLAPFSELVVIQSALKCLFQSCYLVFPSRQTIQRHLSSMHNITTVKSQEIYLSPCSAQSLSTQKFFFMISPASSTQSVTNTLPNTQINDVEAEVVANFMKSIEIKKEKQAQFLFLQQKNTLAEVSAFQTESKYPQFLNGRDFNELGKLLILDNDEEGLNMELISTAVDYMLMKAQNKVFSLNRTCLQSVNSFSTGRMVLKKFKKVQEFNTMRRYAKVFKFFVVFLHQVFLYSLETVSNVSKSLQNVFVMTADMKQIFIEVFSKFVNMVDKVKETKLQINKSQQLSSTPISTSIHMPENLEMPEPQSHDSEGDSSDEDSENILPSEKMWKKQFESSSFALHDISLAAEGLSQLLLTCCQQKSHSTFDNPINSFFAVLAIDMHKKVLKNSFQMAQLYSAFIYCTQLLVILHCVSMHQKEENSKMMLSELMEDFMNKNFRNTSETGLSEILALRAYAFRVNKDTTDEKFHVVLLSPTSLSIGNVFLSLDSLTVLFHKSISHAAQILFKELLLDLDHIKELQDITLEQAAKSEDITDRSLQANFLTSNTFLRQYQDFLENKLSSSFSILAQFFEFQDGGLVPRRKEFTVQTSDTSNEKLLKGIHWARSQHSDLQACYSCCHQTLDEGYYI